MTDRARWPVIHNACGGIAFYTLKKWQGDDVMRASDVETPAGDKIANGDEMVCGACGKPIYRPPSRFLTIAEDPAIWN